MSTQLIDRYRVLLRAVEQLLALGVLIAIAAAAVGGGQALASMDWRGTEALYEFINRVLLLVIAIELARMLVTHNLVAVLELLAFVIARKMLKPDMSSFDIALGVLAFVALVLVRRTLPGITPSGENANPARDGNPDKT